MFMCAICVCVCECVRKQVVYTSIRHILWSYEYQGHMEGEFDLCVCVCTCVCVRVNIKHSRNTFFTACVCVHTCVNTVHTCKIIFTIWTPDTHIRYTLWCMNFTHM